MKTYFPWSMNRSPLGCTSPLTRPSDRTLARRTSELYEPGYDPYNSALHHNRKLVDEALHEWHQRSGTVELIPADCELPPILRPQAE